MSHSVCRAASRALLVALLWVGASAEAADCDGRYTGKAALQSDAQAMVDGFVEEVRASGVPAFERVAVVVHTTPDLTHIELARRTILVPWWDEVDPDTRALFAQRAGSERGGRRLFELMVQRFLVVQQAAFLLTPSGRHRPDDAAFPVALDHYRDEADANALAVAYWMRDPEGRAFLAALLPVVVQGFGQTPDPVPDETTPSVYFNREYQAFQCEPMPYGWFRLRSILNALDTRPSAELATLIEGLFDTTPEHGFSAKAASGNEVETLKVRH